MKNFTIKKPDGTEVVVDRDALVIGYNTREIDAGWLAHPQGSERWERVGVLIGVETTPGSQDPSSQKTLEPRRSTAGAQMQWGFAAIGFLVGALLGFLLRPSVPLIGQLPFMTVLTRGSNLQGLDQLLAPAACTSFNYMLGGAVIGAVGGLVAGKLTGRKQ